VVKFATCFALPLWHLYVFPSSQMANLLHYHRAARRYRRHCRRAVSMASLCERGALRALHFRSTEWRICECVNLRVAPSARAANSLLLLPPFFTRCRTVRFHSAWRRSSACRWIVRSQQARGTGFGARIRAPGGDHHRQPRTKGPQQGPSWGRQRVANLGPSPLFRRIPDARFRSEGNVSSVGGCNLLSIAIVAPVQDAAAQDPVGGVILGGARRRGRLFGLPFLRVRP
jgi:hypothetical protein